MKPDNAEDRRSELTDLLPCPFCGQAPEIVERLHSKARYGICCRTDNCFLFVPTDVGIDSLHNYTPLYVEKSRAVKAWNTRAR